MKDRYYSQEITSIREELFNDLKQSNGFDRFEQQLDYSHLEGSIPSQLESLIINVGLLQCLLWLNEFKNRKE